MQNTKKYTIPAYLKISFEKYSNNKFLGFVDEDSFTYKEVEERVASTISFLEQLGVKKGDKVAVFSNNMPNWGITYFATISMGAICVPLLPNFTETETEYILEHSESKVIFVSDSLKEKTTNISNKYLQSRVLINDFSIISSDKEAAYDLNNKVYKDFDITEEDTALIVYTSGTTGKSKGVMLSHKNIAYNTVFCNNVQPIVESDVFLSILPLSHSYENTLGLLLPMYRGASVKYLKKLPTPAVLIPAMKEVRPTLVLSVPLIIEKIYKSKILPGINKSPIIRNLYKIPVFRKILNKSIGKKLMDTFGGRIKFFGIGGAKLDSLVERFLLEAKFPYAIGYGLTETSPFLAGVNPHTVRWGSTGPVVDGMEIKLHNKNPKTGEGEIWAKGPSIMQGYYKEKGMTDEVIKDGWFNTGDLATLDKDNFIFIHGRSKNVIIGSSGENIYPEDIESVINNFKHVVESVVIERKGKLVALVHLNMDELEKKYAQLVGQMDEVMDDFKVELKNYINSRVNNISAIKAISIQLTPFERTSTFKIKRFIYQ